MPRRRQKTATKAPSLWLVTYCDLVTLLLSFFVLLISMAVVDERRKDDVLQTVRGSLGIGTAISTPLSDKNTPKPVAPGAFDLPADELEPLRDMLWENPTEDLTLQSNRYVQIISINADVLFAPGETALRPEGRTLLGRVVPVLSNLNYPILLAGHASPTRDEVKIYRVSLDPYEFSPTWEISFLRIMSVYEFFKDAGLPADKLMVEGFGEYRPRVSNNTAAGRDANRRVDIVLDKRNGETKLPGDLENESGGRKAYEQKGFIFDVTPPPAEPGE